MSGYYLESHDWYLARKLLSYVHLDDCPSAIQPRRKGDPVGNWYLSTAQKRQGGP